jgi:hypothetical protein
MTRTRILVIFAVVAVVLVASFLVGALFTRYGFEERYPTGLEPRPTIMPEAPTSTSTAKGSQIIADQERMVIYNGYVSVETGDIAGTLDRIRSLAERNGGYVAGTSRSTIGSQATADITIRIPQDKFRTSIQEIETYGKVLDERTTSEDVTERYIDLKARLKNLQIEEQSLSELLTKAKTVDEILRVEQELARVRGEIDSLQGQINYLERNVAMSLITVNLREPPPPFTPPGMDWNETFEIALRGLFGVTRGLIVLVVSILPLIVIIGIPAYYLTKRKKAKAQSKE